MEPVLLGIGVICGIAGAIYSFYIYPRTASHMNDNMPRGIFARRFIAMTLPGGRYDSPEKLAEVRTGGVVALALAIFCAVDLLWLLRRSHN